MDDVQGVPKTLIHWSVALLVGLLLFSLVSFLLLRARERRLARERVVWMDWDGVASVAWAVTSASIVLVSVLTYARIHGHRWWSLGDRIAANQGEGAEEADRTVERFRERREAAWHVGVPLAAVACVLAWKWIAGPRARSRYRGPARHSPWLILPIAVIAGLLLVIGVAYRRAF